MQATWKWANVGPVSAIGEDAEKLSSGDDARHDTSDSDSDADVAEAEARCVEVADAGEEAGVWADTLFVSSTVGYGKALAAPQATETRALAGYPVAKKRARAKTVFMCRHVGCGKVLKDNLARTRHERVHTGEKPFRCAHCGVCFALKKHLQVHVQRKHTHEKPHACAHPGCTWKFVTRGELTVHMRGHTGEKPYACRVDGCGKAFATSAERHRHEVRHKTARQWPCRVPGCRGVFMHVNMRASHELLCCGPLG